MSGTRVWSSILCTTSPPALVSSTVERERVTYRRLNREGDGMGMLERICANTATSGLLPFVGAVTARGEPAFGRANTLLR